MIPEIIKQIEDMRDVLLKCKIKTTTIAFKKERLERASEKELKELAIWLGVTNEVHVKRWKETYALLTPNQWESYTILNIHDLNEQVLLEEAAKDLRNRWAERPNILNRTKKYEPDARAKNQELRDKDRAAREETKRSRTSTRRKR
jgi:hypothetical protein